MKSITAAILIVVSSFAVNAQDKTTRVESTRSETADIPGAVEDLYFALADLTLEDQREQMWALSAKTKARLWRYNLERYEQNHPELDAHARAILREGIALVTSPGWFENHLSNSVGYDAKTEVLLQHKQRVETAFSSGQIREIFIRLGADPLVDDPALGNGANQLSTAIGARPRTNAPTGGPCACASWYECWYHAAGCYDTDCTMVVHCGWYGMEICTGVCKREY